MAKFITKNSREVLFVKDTTTGNIMALQGDAATGSLNVDIGANITDVNTNLDKVGGTAVSVNSGVPDNGTQRVAVGMLSTSSYPMYDRRDLGGYALGTDGAGALQTFSMVTTDEGTGRANFTGSSLSTSPGTATFTNGSTTVTGSGFTTKDVFYLDYIKLGTDTEAAWAQVGFVNSDTSITLNAAYTGTGGTGTYNLAPAATVTGTGASITVASGQATLALGTNTSAATVLYRAAGVPPIRNFLFSTQASISQRVANQDIYIGLESATTSSRYFSRFHFTSTNNTQVITETGYNPTGVPTASETESNTVTIPSSAVSSSVLTYKIISELEKVFFYINEVLVATHLARLPHVAAQTMNAQIRGVNSGAVTNTNVVTNYIYARPYEKLESRPTDTARVQISDGTTNVNVTTGNALKADLTSIAGTATVTAGVSGLLAVGGNVASAATDSGNPVKIGGIYNSSNVTLTNGQRGDLQMTVNAFARTDLATLLSGEDQTSVGPNSSAGVLAFWPKPVVSANYSPSTYQQSGSVTKANIKNAAGNAVYVRITNGNAAVRYFQLHNKASAPAAADAAQLYFIVPAGTATSPGVLELNSMDLSPSEYFSTGIGWAISTTATTFTDSATAGDHNTSVRFV